MHLACKAALTYIAIIPLITNWMIRLEFTFAGISLIFRYNFFFYPAESLYWPVSETQQNWINGCYLILSSLQHWSCIFMNYQSHQCLSVCGSKPPRAKTGLHQRGRYSRESLKIWLAPDREWRAGQQQVTIEWSCTCESCHYSTAYYLCPLTYKC